MDWWRVGVASNPCSDHGSPTSELMSKRDYYEVLGASRDADGDALKKAYRRLAMKLHPDRNPDDDGAAEEKFKEAKEAYDILSDPQKRGAYDQFGHAAVEQSAGGAGFSGGFRDIFDEVFGDIFSGRGGGQRAYRGADLRYRLDLTLEQAVFGESIEIRIPTKVHCTQCAGNGAAPGTSPTTCTTCDGAGQVRAQQGFFSIQQTCPRCRGNGRVITDPCSACRGAGTRQERKTLSIKVPAGVDNGDRIRLSGEGEPGEQGGPPGDLYAEVNVREHEIFEREGTSLFCEVPISYTAAALGGELEVPTLGGRVNLKIPSETQSGRSFRLRGKGVRSVRGGPVGDLICKVAVETPVKLNSAQKELLRKFDESIRGSKKTHDPRSTGWLASVRKFFDSLT